MLRLFVETLRKAFKILKQHISLGQIPTPDAVVLDPSREGANRKVLERLNELKPGRILYVACDPAALDAIQLFCVN